MTTVMMSSSTFGIQLDLKPVGATIAPFPMAECPSNGFVFYPGSEISPDLLQTLAAIVTSEEYRALRGETPYFRDAHIAEKLDAHHSAVSQRLLHATWEVDQQPERYGRYAAALLARIDEDIAIAEDAEQRELWSMLKGELMRRTKAFEAARAHFEALLPRLAEDSELRPIVAYQLTLIAAGDFAAHPVSNGVSPETP